MWWMVNGRKLAVDSGATETVIDTNTLTHVKSVEGPAFKRGVEYAIANCVRIPNLGNKSFKGFTKEGTLKISLRKYAK